MARLFPVLTSLLLATSPLAVKAQETGSTLPQADEHAGMDHGSMDHSQMDMSGMDMSAPDMKGMDHSAHAMPASTVSDEPGDAPPPPVPTDFPAERFFAADRMAASRAAMLKEMKFSTFALQVDQLEFRTGNVGDGFGWEGQAWYGGDIDRILLASEGEGTFGERAERIELGAYWRMHSILGSTCNSACGRTSGRIRSALTRWSASRGWRLTGSNCKVNCSSRTRATFMHAARRATRSASPSHWWSNPKPRWISRFRTYRR